MPFARPAVLEVEAFSSGLNSCDQLPGQPEGPAGSGFAQLFPFSEVGLMSQYDSNFYDFNILNMTFIPPSQWVGTIDFPGDQAPTPQCGYSCGSLAQGSGTAGVGVLLWAP
jgi:hypothetical protein